MGYVGANVLSLLTDDALIATWNNEGLPADGMSTENATILTNSVKWPMIIDPQLQVILHTVILEYFNKIKNKHFPILPFSFSKYSLATKTKIIFQML